MQQVPFTPTYIRKCGFPVQAMAENVPVSVHQSYVFNVEGRASLKLTEAAQKAKKRYNIVQEFSFF